MARKQPQKESVPPTMQPRQAIPLIQRQIERLQQIMTLHRRDPAVSAWLSTTENILNATFGLPNGERHRNTSEFIYAGSGGPIYRGMTEGQIQRNYLLSQQKRQALLQAYIEQLQDLAPPAALVAPEQYRFHPEIERVSGLLFRDGHYKQAALEAYIRVIEEVKARSGLPLDGDQLMNQAFGCDNRTPAIQFNTLQTGAERDEQRGLMFLFKSIVSLRNTKAHSNQLFNDPYRAHDYLALASLLIRVLEMANVNPIP